MNLKKVSLVWLILIACVNPGHGFLSILRLDDPLPYERIEIERFTNTDSTVRTPSHSSTSEIRQSSTWQYSTPGQNKIAEKRHTRSRVSKTFIAECLKAPRRLFFTQKAYRVYCYGYIFLHYVLGTPLRGPPLV